MYYDYFKFIFNTKLKIRSYACVNTKLKINLYGKEVRII
jgi:hypothetical protein